MRIELSENIFWDTESVIQEEETLNWLNDNVRNKLGLDASDPNMITPELDDYGRPVRWVYVGDNFTIEIIREYIFPNSGKWAKRSDSINVMSNE